MRIVIDTLELDELADSNRRTAGETHEIEGALGRGTLHTRLSSDDPGIRVAQVSARYADIQGVLRWLEANYDEHGRELLALSQQTRDSQSGPGLTLPGWPWPALPLPDLLRRWGDWSRIDLLPVIPVPLRRPLSRFDRVAAELSTLLGKGSTALPTVERGLATTTLGLFGSATRGVQSMIDRFGHFLSAVGDRWAGILGGVSELFRRYARELKELIQRLFGRPPFVPRRPPIVGPNHLRPTETWPGRPWVPQPWHRGPAHPHLRPPKLPDMNLPIFRQGGQPVRNDDILQKARDELGHRFEHGWDGAPGECFVAMTRWVKAAGGTWRKGSGPFEQLEANGGVQISPQDARPGDILQIATPGAGWNGQLHTAVIVGREPDGTYRVIDCNRGWDGAVHEGPYRPALRGQSELRIYRVGQV